MAIITARGFGYRHASRKNPVFSDLDFTVDRGEKLLLLGASGSGKSTLLAAIAGVLGSDDGDFSGELTVSGVVGMVLQDPDSQVIASRVGDDVAFGCENLGVSREETWRRVRRGLELVGLDLPLDHPTAELSGGQKQRLALAGVLAMGADIIVLDEPTANLDPAGVQEVVHAVTRVVAETGATVIIVEHRVATWQGLIGAWCWGNANCLSTPLSAGSSPTTVTVSPARASGCPGTIRCSSLVGTRPGRGKAPLTCMML